MNQFYSLFIVGIHLNLVCWGRSNVVSDHFPTVVCVLYLDCELIEKKIPRKKFKKKRPKINFDHFKSTQINPNFVTLLINQSPLIRFNESLLCWKVQPQFQCNKLALRKGKMWITDQPFTLVCAVFQSCKRAFVVTSTQNHWINILFNIIEIFK